MSMTTTHPNGIIARSPASVQIRRPPDSSLVDEALSGCSAKSSSADVSPLGEGVTVAALDVVVFGVPLVDVATVDVALGFVPPGAGFVLVAFGGGCSTPGSVAVEAGVVPCAVGLTADGSGGVVPSLCAHANSGSASNVTNTNIGTFLMSPYCTSEFSTCGESHVYVCSGAMTSTVQDTISAIRDRTVVSTVLAVLFLIAPGALGILQFGGALITQLNWVVFVLLALSVTVPVAVFNVFVLPFTFGSGEMAKGPNGFFYDFVVNAVTSGLFLCIILALSFLFVWTLALTCFIVLCFEIMFVLVAVARWWKDILRVVWPD
jgi:hypothetical protein